MVNFFDSRFAAPLPPETSLFRRFGEKTSAHAAKSAQKGEIEQCDKEPAPDDRHDHAAYRRANVAAENGEKDRDGHRKQRRSEKTDKESACKTRRKTSSGASREKSSGETAEHGSDNGQRYQHDHDKKTENAGSEEHRSDLSLLEFFLELLENRVRNERGEIAAQFRDLFDHA
jgi:hypothetical protein